MIKCLPSIIIELAENEVGYKEKASNNKLETKTENSGKNNYTKYADYIDKNYPDFYNGKKNGYAWCDVFVDYLFIKSFGVENAMRMLYQPVKSCGAGCTYSMRYYKSANRFDKVPSVGSQIFFGNRAEVSNHTGIVTSVSDECVYTIEGNSSNGVVRKTYSLSDKTILGYGHPMYDKEEIVKEKMVINVDAKKYSGVVINWV